MDSNEFIVPDKKLNWLIENYFKLEDVESSLEKKRSMNEFYKNCWNFIIEEDYIEGLKKQKIKITFNMNIKDKESLMLNLFKEIPNHKEWENENFMKIKLNFHKFVKLYSFILYDLTLTREGRINKIKHFFRSTECQKTFKEINKIKFPQICEIIFLYSL